MREGRKPLLVGMPILVALVGVCMPVRTMPVIVVVHQLLRHVGKHLARGRRRAAGPLDAALLARGREQVVPRQLRRIARHLQALGERGEHQLADAPAVPALAERRQLRQPRGIAA